MRALVACGTALALAACAHEASQTVASDASPSPVADYATPLGTSASAHDGTPARVASNAAASSVAGARTVPATAAAASSVALAAPAVAAGPKIYALTESTEVVHAGQSISFAASTTPDIESVTANVAAYTLPFVRTGAGRFSLAFSIPPNVPGLFHGSYSLAVTARSHSGATVSRSIAITFE